MPSNRPSESLPPKSVSRYQVGVGGLRSVKPDHPWPLLTDSRNSLMLTDTPRLGFALIQLRSSRKSSSGSSPQIHANPLVCWVDTRQDFVGVVVLLPAK